jgi:broad specificity phosphatase PhoE
MKKQFRKMRRKPFYLPLVLPIAAALALLAMALWWGSQWQSMTVIIVRHAEKTTVGDDPGLAPRGEARAELLSRMLAPISVGGRPLAVYSTDYRRTRATAGAVAKAWQVDVQLYDAGQASETASAIRGRHRAATVLIVGHSNTVPELVAAFGGPAGVEIADDDYDNLFILTVPPFGSATTVRLSFGDVLP